MSLEKEVAKRSLNQCEFCSSQSLPLVLYIVAPKSGNNIEDLLHLCLTCKSQIESKAYDEHHWRFLSDAMWSELDAIKVMSYRILHDLKSEVWANDLLEMFYIDEDLETWAKEGLERSDIPKHLDANGIALQAGDSVVLIKDLKVKGTNFTAKRGTAVINISLDMDNEKYIEGKVDGQKIVLITDYVKK